MKHGLSITHKPAEHDHMLGSLFVPATKSGSQDTAFVQKIRPGLFPGMYLDRKKHSLHFSIVSVSSAVFLSKEAVCAIDGSTTRF